MGVQKLQKWVQNYIAFEIREMEVPQMCRLPGWFLPHIHHTHIYILWSRVQIAKRLPERNLHSWLLRRCISGDFCACISSGLHDTGLVRFQPQRRRKWRLHLPLCCQSVWIWSGPQCFMPSQVQLDRQDMPWNYIIIISLVYSSVCLSKSFHSLSEVSFSSLRSLHRLVTHSYLFSVHQIYFDKG